MKARQSGIPMSKLMSISNGDSFTDELIMQAYSKPRYSGKKYQTREVERFRNYAESVCFNSWKSKK